MQRLLEGFPGDNGPWIEVQAGRYQYAVEYDPVRVRIILSDYLAAEFRWTDED